ncbi:MAG: flavin reductase family protein, partial [Alphaproteobacteria bacterium]|nr:flavin reductase family protein [Alphaproteobacteria bacterium]
FGAGVTIVTTFDGQTRAGLTATAVCSLSAEPPQLLVCVNRQAYPNRVIARAKRFCVNVLASGQAALALRFAGATGHKGEDRFAKGRWNVLATGAPVLDGALTSFDCELARAIRSGTHTIFIGRVLAVTTRQSGPALLSARGGFAGVVPGRAKKPAAKKSKK